MELLPNVLFAAFTIWLTIQVVGGVVLIMYHHTVIHSDNKVEWGYKVICILSVIVAVTFGLYYMQVLFDLLIPLIVYY